MRVEDKARLEFYTRPGKMTDAGQYTSLLTDLPGDPAAIAETLHGLVFHEFMAEAYGVRLSDEDWRPPCSARTGRPPGPGASAAARNASSPVPAGGDTAP